MSNEERIAELVEEMRDLREQIVKLREFVSHASKVIDRHELLNRKLFSHIGRLKDQQTASEAVANYSARWWTVFISIIVSVVTGIATSMAKTRLGMP